MDKSLQVDQHTLVQAWQQQLPEMLGAGDSSIVQGDNANPQALCIHINVAGHQKYSFDFSCAYQDSRELKVSLTDVERDGRSVDEHTEIIQELADDYVRHIHECAQVLHSVTNPIH